MPCIPTATATVKLVYSCFSRRALAGRSCGGGQTKATSPYVGVVVVAASWAGLELERMEMLPKVSVDT